MFTALLVDDEPLANERMQELLAVHAGIEVVGVAGCVAEARAFLERHPPDVVFLDVEMPGGSGLELLGNVPDRTQVVFVTAREKYAVQAFAASALDYLVKPVDPDRLADTLVRLRRILRLLRAETAAGSTADEDDDADEDSQADDLPDERAGRSPAAVAPLNLDATIGVPLMDGGGMAVVRIGDICWIEALRNYTRVALDDPGRVVIFRRRLSGWHRALPGGAFARLGRSVIVQVAAIQQLEWRSRDETVAGFGLDVEPLTLGRVLAGRLRDIIASLRAGS